jgi:hypothetical protein
MINELLREHTTSIGFAITLSKAQIRTLVILHYFGGFQQVCDVSPGARLLPNNLYSPSNALERRGLLGVGPCNWKITKAGKLVIGLLKEAVATATRQPCEM